MIKGGWFPCAGGVALSTIRAELAFVRIILGVAGAAVLWGAFENIIDVAA